jgi:signal transduction histidine kinase/DNA-binding NarL/FixJ family response regulator/HPt (histidine-containing phosphotransfer) domain-containing protein
MDDRFRSEADERIRAMFDATPLACTFWDAEGNLVDCNQEALNLFEVPAKEEFCRRFPEFSPALQADGSFSRERITQNFWDTIREGVKKFSWLHRSASGRWLPCFVHMVRINFRDGYRVLGYTRDMRDIQELQDRRRESDERNRELEVQTRAAQVASEAKSRFLASMSHEIRTPMNAIIGMSDLMRTDNLDETQKSFFEDIKKMSRTLLQIINDILDISKIEMGKMELYPVHFDLRELYDNLCSMNRFSAESKNLEFRQSFDAVVPRIIYGDDVRIRQILINLLNNAVKYTREGFVEFTVGRTEREGKDHLVFTVRDSGIGIRKEDFPRLFGNFQQLGGGENRGIMGTGLGLAITKNLTDMMKGEIRFDSEYGTGSVFTVCLPLVKGDPERVERKGIKSRFIAAADTKVLVVDDSRINLKVALAFLAAHGIRADTAESGEEAVEKVRRVSYDLVLMDHMMPGMDGIETTRRIRALANGEEGGKRDGSAAGASRFATLPVIALTANAVSGSRERLLAAGMNDFISKPIDASDLNAKLIKWLKPERIVRFELAKGDSRSGPETDAVIDRQAGIRRAGGDETLYGQICASFLRDHGGDFAGIRDALEAGDLSGAHRLAHTLKSVAGLIGAGPLRRTAMELEESLVRENVEDARGQLKFLERNLEAVKAELGSPASGGESRTEGEELPLSVLCDRLFPLLKSGNTLSLDLVKKHRGTLMSLDGKGGILVQQIENFEFPAALATLEEIHRSAGAGE